MELHKWHSIIIIPLFFIIFPLILMLKKKYFHCKCEVCHAYVTSNWSKKFPNLCDWYAHLLKTSPTKTIHIHVLNNIITANPKNVEYMLKTNFDNYPKGKPFSSILGDLLGHGIFNVDGDEWRFQRKMASLELDRQSVRSFSFYVVKDEMDHKLKPYLSNQSNQGLIINFQDIFRVFSFTTICKFSFGVEIGELKHNTLEEFSTSFDMASNLSAQRALEVCSWAWKLKRLLGLGMERRLHGAIKTIDGLAMEVIRLRRKLALQKSPAQQRDLLSRFMGSVKNDDKFLRDIIVSFLLAGRDTVASALTSFFFIVAHHPKVESAIVSEAERVLGSSSHGLDQLRELQYLQAAIHESMRLYPPIQFDSKFSIKDDVLPDRTEVRKGVRVTYHPYAMGRMEEIWGEDCLEFKPERWLNKDGIFFNQSPYKYPVFQGGFRVCLGKEMALVEIKWVIVSILREFHVELAFDHQIQTPLFSPGLTASFKGGLPVFLHRRESHIVKSKGLEHVYM